MIEGIGLVLLLIICFLAGYYLLPWLLHGESPRQTWRRDHEK